MTIDRRATDRLRRKAEAVDRAYRDRDQAIREEVAAGASYAEVAEAVGLSKSAISKIINRKES